MASAIAWLDMSSDEQRRIRELIALFTETESRDELGVGQIRDAFSESMFPGTSVIQTRARYYLFLPWHFREGTRKGRSGRELARWVDGQERRLIESLRVAGDLAGLIGRVAGIKVKTLPSTIYWSGLLRYGIFTRDVPTDRLGVSARPLRGSEGDELAGRAIGDWHPTLPPMSPGFPSTVPEGFRLSGEEASWLRDVIRVAAPGYAAHRCRLGPGEVGQLRRAHVLSLPTPGWLALPPPSATGTVAKLHDTGCALSPVVMGFHPLEGLATSVTPATRVSSGLLPITHVNAGHGHCFRP